ncbi:hypothetical protein IAQ61_007827 [Plenodomus lingam]|uniref:uncharacterized protein n=1 Tax=Leptosphaeria maculans TaxID=5022 RepID=UPI00332FED67|nr:hypothetical protein IAQ61_007827 [Plenodomus lingam]
MFMVAIPFIIISSIVVFLRFHVRWNLLRSKLTADDWLILSGTFFTILLSVANMICGWYGVGMHTVNIPTQNLTPMLKANLATRLLYVVAICLVKFSILVFYRELDPRKGTRLIVYVLMASVAVLSIVTFFVLLFVCTPPSLFWDLQGQARNPEKCIPQSTQQVFFNTNGIINIVQDIAIYVLPLSIVWKLQMPRRQKVALCTLLCVGLIAVAAGCVRLYYVLFLANDADTWYYMADSLNWCSIEIYAAIICNSASTFRAILTTYIPKLWGSSPSRSGYSNYRDPKEQSREDAIALKPSRGLVHKSLSNRMYGITDVTEIGNGSEEAIITPEIVKDTNIEISSMKRP